MKDCVFCKIVKGELPSTKEYEDKDVLVFQNIKPAAETHLLIVPKKHKSSFMDLSGSDISSMFEVAQKLIKDKKLSDGYKLVFNGGKFQFVPHIHWHLLAGKFEKDFEEKL
ncbi:hypothetical protein A2961_03580 [Candidatus Woesebacteria bacterium RIFCSPLOWO2_01_FULL_39_21]|uniref:HIT domain-containing protein n=1 Tax=Candidatus Woesebacteria bacterium RIFCSPLOWO2_01_FULL_39_21 TaxID=1802519 RepID=A0A1F8BJR3_9BACT|nr:MAG: hypothetical protein A2691_01280 [Candidatus Woesebacteria bacterium RIFCSPHIGHO2_01_FULL_39_23]OGM64200.1 MAG: hypothetical protein A2961_03580 [Candidatus Woesebacteria bacterium RIFCSPLOWO2_01_FULL_39_21]